MQYCFSRDAVQEKTSHASGVPRTVVLFAMYAIIAAARN